MNFSIKTLQGMKRIFSFSEDGLVFSVGDQSLCTCRHVIVGGTHEQATDCRWVHLEGSVT